MAEIVARGTVLADSTFRTRPHFRTIMFTDANAGGNAVRQIEEKRRLRHMKFPTISGRHDVDSFQDMGSMSYKRWNEDGDYRAPAPFRSHDIITDPVSGFVSAGGDVDRKTGFKEIKKMGQFQDDPQTVVPQFTHSIRKDNPAAPPETNRLAQSDPGPPSLWNSRAVSDVSIRAHLGGWTSKRDSRLTEDGRIKAPLSQCFTPMSFREKSNPLRDKLAQNFMFTSSIQRSYGDVPFDSMMAPKIWPATTTLEDRPDMIDQRYTLRRYYPKAQEWQAVGPSWDRCQDREGFFAHAGPNGVVFCSPTLRNEHIPGYSGSIGAKNLDDQDNKLVNFQPFTVKRNDLPWYSETAHRPNIPRYDGCTLYTKVRKPAHSGSTRPEPESTRRVHRSFPIPENLSEFKRQSIMSKMVTTVPPGNPFNTIKKSDITVETPDSSN